MFQPDLAGHPQGVLYDICSVCFTIPIRVLTYDWNWCYSKLWV